MEPQYATRAEARRAGSPPTITVRETRTAEEQDRYLSSLEAGIDAIRDWAEKYAHLIDDDTALTELENIVSVSVELHLARREAAVKSEASRTALLTAARLLQQIADRGSPIAHDSVVLEVDDTRP